MKVIVLIVALIFAIESAVVSSRPTPPKLPQQFTTNFSLSFDLWLNPRAPKTNIGGFMALDYTNGGLTINAGGEDVYPVSFQSNAVVSPNNNLLTTYFFQGPLCWQLGALPSIITTYFPFQIPANSSWLGEHGWIDDRTISGWSFPVTKLFGTFPINVTVSLWIYEDDGSIAYATIRNIAFYNIGQMSIYFTNTALGPFSPAVYFFDGCGTMRISARQINFFAGDTKVRHSDYSSRSEKMALAMEGDFKRITSFMGKDSIDVDKVKATIDGYNNLFIEENGGNLEARRENYMKMVNDFYDLVTHFYEYGWGQSLHFAPRHRYESFEASVSRLEYYIALKLKLDKGMRVLDVGCGIGGPARAIARFSQATIIGLNNNTYQLQRCRDITKEFRLTNLEWLQGDFHHIPAEDNSIDAGFSFEAIEHAPQKVVVYKELFRVLKPGACFADLEWVMTNKYDPNNKKHNDIKMGIMKGNGLPDIETVEEVLQAAKEAGFEIVHTEDMALTGDMETPWYDSLEGKFSLTGFRHTRLGHWATHAMVSTLEAVGIAPKGTVATSTMLMKTAVALVESGKLGIFSPDYLIVMRKPLEKKKN